MSLQRWAKRRDAAERPIIEALEAKGYNVHQLDVPCDLIVRDPGWPGGMFMALEVKTPRGRARRAKLDGRQKAQLEFCASTGTPIIKSPVEALGVLDEVFRSARMEPP